MLWWIQDELGDTALIEACDGGHVGTATLLIDYGARVDYKNKVSLKNMQNVEISLYMPLIACWSIYSYVQFGQHSLYFASYDGKLSIVRLLIQRGAEIDLPTDVSIQFILQS